MKLSKTILACCLAAASFGVPIAAGWAAAPMVHSQAPGYYRTMLGEFEITVLSDGTVGLPVDQLLQGINKKDLEKILAHDYLSLPVETSDNAYLINTGAKLVLIDAGSGALYGPTLGKLVMNLKASGYQPEQIDEIYITHMHPDHVGGLANNGQRVFINAIVRAEQQEANYWLSAANLANAPPELKPAFEGAQASLKPYIDAGKFSPFKDNTKLMAGIHAVVTPDAHSPGHSTYTVESKGKRMVVLGDLIHVGAVQFDKPKVAISFDGNMKNAIKERIQAFDQIAKEGDLAAGAHLSFPGLGHIRKDGNGYEWLPLNYQSAP